MRVPGQFVVQVEKADRSGRSGVRVRRVAAGGLAGYADEVGQPVQSARDQHGVHGLWTIGTGTFACVAAALGLADTLGGVGRRPLARCLGTRVPAPGAQRRNIPASP